MTEKEKMIAGKWYDAADAELCELRAYAHSRTEEFNRTTGEDAEKRRLILAELLGGIGEGSSILPTVKFDYGCNTYIGSRCFVNFNAVFLDCAQIRLGNDVFVGPGVFFLTPTHPLLARARNLHTGEDGALHEIEAAKPITVEDNVWLGGGVVITPVVTIGHDAVIGAGSVVTRDIPAGVVAAGNPCRVLRPITEADRIDMA